MELNEKSSLIEVLDIRIWRHGDFPMPDWVPLHMIGGIEANGTFTVLTEFGRTRVHPNSVIIERNGSVWIKDLDDAKEFVKQMQTTDDLPTHSIGPGKIYQFGCGLESKMKQKKKLKNNVNGRRYLPPVGSQPSIEWVHLNRLSVDIAYQRSVENSTSQRLIASIATKFDWRLCAPLVVSRRADETLTIIDGQHRWAAARQRDDVPQLPCCIFRYNNTQEEARMFVVANRARKPINRLDDYFAALAAKDDDALEIQQIVEDAGLKISRSTSSTAWDAGEISFTSSISKSIRKFGAENTSAALKNMATAFPGQRLVHGGAIFAALVEIIAKSDTDFEPDRLIAALKTKKMNEWGLCVVGINGGDKRASALRVAIMNAYGSDAK